MDASRRDSVRPFGRSADALSHMDTDKRQDALYQDVTSIDGDARGETAQTGALLECQKVDFSQCCCVSEQNLLGGGVVRWMWQTRRFE